MLHIKAFFRTSSLSSRQSHHGNLLQARIMLLPHHACQTCVWNPAHTLPEGPASGQCHSEGGYYDLGPAEAPPLNVLQC
jgi:hypothetical protein